MDTHYIGYAEQLFICNRGPDRMIIYRVAFIVTKHGFFAPLFFFTFLKFILAPLILAPFFEK